MLFYLTLDEVDIDFGLAAGGDAVKQCDLLLHHRQQYLIVGCLLGFA